MAYEYRSGSLHCDRTPLAEIAAKAGTPCYVYSASAIVSRFREYNTAFGDFPHQICYAVKANSNLSILALLAREGASFDIVSGGELFRVLRAGGDPGRVVFSGVGKTADEIEYALRSDIHTFNCESEGELKLLNEIAGRMGKRARIALRINPDVDAATHPYISTGLREHKFGIDIDSVDRVYQQAMRLPNLTAESVSCHIGSQLLDTTPMMDAVERMIAVAERLRSSGVPIYRLDLGGGLGVAYREGEQSPSVADLVRGIRQRVEGRSLEVALEPGRSIVAESGVLLTRVLYRKRTQRKEFVVVDAAMNDLIRPALYQSHHEILPVSEPAAGGETIFADIVGPVCESGDFLARDRQISQVAPGDLLAVATAGAYGFVQSSNYNSRPRAAEVLVEGDSWKVVRRRETFEDLVQGE